MSTDDESSRREEIFEGRPVMRRLPPVSAIEGDSESGLSGEQVNLLDRLRKAEETGNPEQYVLALQALNEFMVKEIKEKHTHGHGDGFRTHAELALRLDSQAYIHRVEIAAGKDIRIPSNTTDNRGNPHPQESSSLSGHFAASGVKTVTELGLGYITAEAVPAPNLRDKSPIQIVTTIKGFQAQAV